MQECTELQKRCRTLETTAWRVRGGGALPENSLSVPSGSSYERYNHHTEAKLIFQTDTQFSG